MKRLNKHMASKDLRNLETLYSESWLITSPSQPGDAKGLKQPVETKDSISYKGLFGSGSGAQRNPYALGQASGQEPFEQEEDSMISKQMVLRLIGGFMAGLDSRERLDQSAVMVLSKLKNEIKKI